MKILSTLVVAGAVWLCAEGAASAQAKTIPGETIVVTATIEAIELSSRTLTIRDDKGLYETLEVSPEVKRFAELKVGDRVTFRYYDNVVVRLKRPNEAAIDVDQSSLTPGAGKRPGGTVSKQRTITATVVAIDQTVPSITVRGPNGWTYSRKVADKKALAQVKVGDQLDITWSEALLISVESPK